MITIHGRSLAIAIAIALVFLFLAFTGSREVPGTFHVGDPRDPLPQGWNAKEFLDGVRHAVRGEARHGDLGRAERDTNRIDVHLLAWKLKHSAETLDYALAWVRVETAGQDRWTVVWMVRFSEDFRWVPFYHHHEDLGVLPFHSFDHPPWNAEIYAFLDTVPSYEYRFFDRGADEPVISYGGREDFRGVDVGQAAVREHTWKAIVGEAPIRSFNFK